MYVLGIDDSSRCPVIGSMIVCGVCADLKTIRYFKKIGVKDSKLLTETKRFKLLDAIIENAYVSIRKLTPELISMENGYNLNDKEMLCFLSIANDFNFADKIIADNFDHSRQAFIKRAEKLKSFDWSKWKIEHNADYNYTIVGAASIVAKCVSDIEMHELRKIYDIGSGNPNDKKTEAFIKKHIACADKSKCDGCKIIRWNWYTIKRLGGEI